MQRLIFSIGLVLLVSVASAATQHTNTVLSYVDAQQASPGALVVDTRGQAVCMQRSLAGAHCLPATDFLGPNGELPSFADIFWALGTAGIDGSETILVTGDKPLTRDFVAGLLYLCGQARIEILSSSVEKVLRAGLRSAGRGRTRGILRQRIYHASMRDQLLVLPSEVSSATVNAQPVIPIKAENYLPRTPSLSELNPDRRNNTEGNALLVIYAEQPVDAIALFARLLVDVTNPVAGMRVMPVASQGLLGCLTNPAILHARAKKPAFIAIIRKGEKQWT